MSKRSTGSKGEATRGRIPGVEPTVRDGAHGLHNFANHLPSSRPHERPQVLTVLVEVEGGHCNRNKKINAA